MGLALRLGLGLGGGGAPAYNVYVDSVSGSDSNSGLSLTSAKQTLLAAKSAVTAFGNGARLALVRGSHWREQFDIPNNNLTIGVVGVGDMPIIDGADVVTTGWTQPDSVTYPNVWSRSWTRSSATTTGSEYLGYWEAGSRTTRRADLAALQAGSNGDWHTTSLTTQTSTVSIRAAADPNSDGIVREITKRHYGINGHAQIVAANRTGCAITGPIELKRCVGHYNTLAGPKDGSSRNLWLREGNIHHTVTEGALSEDLLATEYHPDIAPSVFAAYRADGSALDHTFRRCIAAFPSRILLANSSTFYAHASFADAAARDITIEGCLAVNIPFGNAASANFTVTGGYCKDSWDSHIAAAAYQNTIRYFVGLDTSGISSGGSNRSGIRRLSNATFTPDLDLRDSAFVVRFGLPARLANSTYTTTVVNCFFVSPSATPVSGVAGDRGGPSISYSVMHGTRSYDQFTSGYVGDFNVFYFVGQPAPQFEIDGAVHSTLSAWQGATGQDANSVFLKHADQTAGSANAFWLGVAENLNTGPFDGDFRINPNAYVYNGAGTRLTGTFADGTTPITAAGPQAYWDFNQRAVVSGTIPGFPTVPNSVSEYREYVESPDTWDFYP